jgi:hypothetical protein
MNDWYLMIAFIAGMAVNRYIILWELTAQAAELEEKNK